MAQRLVEIYKPGDMTEILLRGEDAEEWCPAVVRGLDHPGVWVQTSDRRMWFVTNGCRIRPLTPVETGFENGTQTSKDESGGIQVLSAFSA